MTKRAGWFSRSGNRPALPDHAHFARRCICSDSAIMTPMRVLRLEGIDAVAAYRMKAELSESQNWYKSGLALP